MRELRNCDFCDGDAAGAFEIVPPELEPTETEQRRVVLCPDCRERLEGLLEPLLARVRDGSGTTGATDGERSDGSGSVAAAGGSTTDRSPSGDQDATVPTDTVSTDPDPPEDDAGADSGAAGSDGGSDSSLEAGITFERDERAPDTESADETAADPAADDGDASAAAADGQRDPGDDRNEDATDASSRPAAYAKVVRLLRNREFPMKRSAVEELAAGAYDLERREVEAIVDRAIEDGEFVEKQGKLRRP